ncbi:hypothetical protein L4D06_16150 [Enterovibrio makurazakiensis]|uniref:hypothetical protein n=1 Tax=Enterovibrio makurazakiensis TaxID=2910232 RepID=UPI003D19A622
MICIDRVGKVIEGDDVGTEIQVTQATDGTGAYYILMSDDFSNPETDKFDSWVESLEDVEEYFKESNWVIEWQ